jgi:hypothetical protein
VIDAVIVRFVLLLLRLLATTVPPRAENTGEVGALGAVVSTTNALRAERSVVARVSEPDVLERMAPSVRRMMAHDAAGQTMGVLFVRSALVCPAVTAYRKASWLGVETGSV